MSAQFEVAVAEIVPVAASASVKEMESAWQEAWEARGRAAEMGDYVAAERWHNQAREIATQIEAREQDALVSSR